MKVNWQELTQDDTEGMVGDRQPPVIVSRQMGYIALLAPIMYRKLWFMNQAKKMSLFTRAA